VDLTVVATPGYFATMGAEYRYLKKRAERQGPSAADYERRDTIASLTMGVASLVAPLVMPKLLAPITPGKGKYGKALVATAAAAVAVTTIADVIARRRTARWARRVARVGGVTAVVAGGLAVTTTLASRLTADRMWKRRRTRDLDAGPLAVTGAVLAWDLIYYWNHRFMHESRYMWAIHVVHHSSERYNLSTALRQPVADAVGTFLPYSALCLVGFRPELVATARGVNLLYQYWIHTDTIRRLGPFERVLNTPSHHRVHHGSNPQYIDRNHGSILIVWDKLFGTFEPESETVVYGLTKNIETFDPGRIATHEHADMLRDVAHSTTWRDRLSYVLRGPGWTSRRHKGRREVLVPSP
jgi:sterol desaturase/sphingolipid hydroxylase (fatty acid hydroxylase superfamily)